MQSAATIENRYSLADFQQHLDKHIDRVKETHQPIKLTVNGKVEFVLLDAESYQRMLEAVDYAEAVEGIRQGLEEVERGETVPAHQVLEEMRREFNIPDKS